MAGADSPGAGLDPQSTKLVLVSLLRAIARMKDVMDEGDRAVLKDSVVAEPLSGRLLSIGVRMAILDNDAREAGTEEAHLAKRRELLGALWDTCRGRGAPAGLGAARRTRSSGRGSVSARIGRGSGGGRCARRLVAPDPSSRRGRGRGAGSSTAKPDPSARPRPTTPRGLEISRTSRGAAAAATWIVRGGRQIVRAGSS